MFKLKSFKDSFKAYNVRKLCSDVITAVRSFPSYAVDILFYIPIIRNHDTAKALTKIVTGMAQSHQLEVSYYLNGAMHLRIVSDQGVAIIWNSNKWYSWGMHGILYTTSGYYVWNGVLPSRMAVFHMARRLACCDIRRARAGVPFLVWISGIMHAHDGIRYFPYDTTANDTTTYIDT